MSVVTKSEGPRIEIAEGRSERPVVVVEVGELTFESATIRSERASKVGGWTEDRAGLSSQVGVVVGIDVEAGMLESEGSLEREQGGFGEVDDEGIGCDEQAMQLPRGHRFRAAAAAFGLGAWAAKTSRKSFSSSRASSRSAATARS